MITDKQIETMLKTVPSEIYRDVAGALTGAKNGMSAVETAKFYSIGVPFVQECWNKYGLTTETLSSSTGKRSDKNNAIKKFLESNIGKTIKPQDLVDASGLVPDKPKSRPYVVYGKWSLIKWLKIKSNFGSKKI